MESEEGMKANVIVSLVFAIYMFVMVFEPHRLIMEVFKKDES